MPQAGRVFYAVPMPISPLTIWCNPLISDPARALLIDRARPHHLVFSQSPTYNLVAGPPDPALIDADVAFGQPDPQTVLESPRLRWIHLTSAGYARYDTDEFRSRLSTRNAVLTNSSHVYSEPCAEHAFAFMLANARQLLPSFQVQLTDRSWPTAPRRVASRLLLGQTVALLGFGAIARRLVELLAPFEMKIFALRRSRSGDEGVPVLLPDEFIGALGTADHVVNTLPEGLSTAKFVTARYFDAMKPDAVFYNVGRGKTIDQDALIGALQSDRLAAAYLDVTDPEPLPADHPLWTTRGCYITPHTAGGHSDEHERFVLHFLENLRRFTTGEPLLDRVM